jgi:hypothetical protein
MEEWRLADRRERQSRGVVVKRVGRLRDAGGGGSNGQAKAPRGSAR